MSKTPVKIISLGTMEIGKRMNATQGESFIREFQKFGHTELDTAYMYGTSEDGTGGKSGGNTEELMGGMPDGLIKWDNIATKVNPGSGKTLSGPSIRNQLETSLRKLKVPKVDILYLHWPCLDTPIEETLAMVDELYREGKFVRFGLSNYISWQVSEIQAICEHRGFIKPTVYQGMYNCLTRAVEPELMSCLRRYNMSFYCYNPLAGGMLTGKHTRGKMEDSGETRFTDAAWGAVYRARFATDAYFDALDVIREACKAAPEEGQLTLTEVALRWLVHHSVLDGQFHDGIIVGGSNAAHLTTNLGYLKGGPLPSPIVEAVDRAARIARPYNPNYFRNVASAFKL